MAILNASKKIVVIITSFNRRDITLRFLDSLVRESSSSVHNFSIYLMDDLSPDGTGDAVVRRFPEVKVIYGTGELYWAGGVRLILQTIGKQLENYDAILLVNDDIVLKKGSLDTLINYAFSENAIMGGTVLARNGEVESSGSLLGKFCRPKPRILIANGHLQRCELLPGHILLIPIHIYEDLGGFDEQLPFRFLDLEFTYRASRSGNNVLLAPDVVALTDEVHNYYNETSNMRGSLSHLIKRILLNPKGPYW